MLEKAKTLIDLFRRRGYKAFFIGGKPRNDARNSGKFNKVLVDNIDIITSMPKEVIKKMFPTAQDGNLVVPSVNITFADKQFKILFFNYDESFLEQNLVSIKSTKVRPKLIDVPCLDEIRIKLDFTINTLVQELNSTVIDYSFEKNKQLISALQDVKKEIIRAVNGKQTFIDDPLRILRMFKMQSMLQFKIDQRTFKDALECKHLLESIHPSYFVSDFNKIITSPGVKLAIKQMKRFGFFNLTINDQPFMRVLNNVNDKDLTILERYCQTAANNEENEKTDLLEAYTLLLLSNTEEEIRDFFSTFHPLEDEEESIERIIWMVQHKDILDGTNLRQKIFQARNDGIVARERQSGMLIVIRKLAHIAKLLNGKQAYNDVYGAYCERPYFSNQLRVNNEEIASFMGKTLSDDFKENLWLEPVKDAILNRLINVEGSWPYEYDKYMEHVRLGILDVYPDAEVNIPPEQVIIDDYGNVMDHMKAIQHKRIPINEEGPEIIRVTEDMKLYSNALINTSNVISSNNEFNDNEIDIELFDEDKLLEEEDLLNDID